MFNKFLFRKLMIVIFAVLSFSSQSLQAQYHGFSYSGVSYSSGSWIGGNVFYMDNSWYTTATLAFPSADSREWLGNPVPVGPNFSMDDMISTRLGFFISDFEPFYVPISVGFGFNFAGSAYNSNGLFEAFVRAGFEIPILIKPIKDLPILILPFWEVAQDGSHKGKDWDHKRYGVTAIGHLLMLYPLIFQFEVGIAKTDVFKYEDYNIESGVGYHWRIGVGYDLGTLF